MCLSPLILSFCIYFSAYNSPVSLCLTRLTWPKEPVPSTFCISKSVSPYLFLFDFCCCFALDGLFFYYRCDGLTVVGVVAVIIWWSDAWWFTLLSEAVESIMRSKPLVFCSYWYPVWLLMILWELDCPAPCFSNFRLCWSNCLAF